MQIDPKKFCPLPTDYYKAAFVARSEGFGVKKQPVHIVSFEVTDGDLKYARIWGYINQSSNGIGQMGWRFIRALLGTPPEPSRNYTFEELKGKECYIYVELIERGGRKTNAIRDYVRLGDFADIEGCRIPSKL